jgi:hypothetical protein
MYSFDAIIEKISDQDGAYIAVPINIRQVSGKGRLKAHATFDGHPHDGSVVNHLLHHWHQKGYSIMHRERTERLGIDDVPTNMWTCKKNVATVSRKPTRIVAAGITSLPLRPLYGITA